MVFIELMDAQNTHPTVTGIPPNKCPWPVYGDFGIDLDLEMMELSEYRDLPTHSLSRGQRQKLAVASILSMEPDIIVLDEPTTGQDRGHLNKFLARMKMFNEA